MKTLRQITGLTIGVSSLFFILIASVFMVIASGIATFAHWIAHD